MIRLIRILGFLMIGLGVVFILTWAVAPLRSLWPWILTLPLPLRLGLAAAASGLLLLLGSLIWDRYEEREQDRELRDDL